VKKVYINRAEHVLVGGHVKGIVLAILLVAIVLTALSMEERYNCSAAQGDVLIVSAVTGRTFFGTWWPIGKFAKSRKSPDIDSYVEVKVTLKNNLNVSKDVEVSASFLDSLNQALGMVSKSVTVPPGETLDVFTDPFLLPTWAFVSPPQAHVEIDASPFYDSKTVYFDILGPSVYSLTVKTYSTAGSEIPGVNVWMDGFPAKSSPATWSNVLFGTHVINAQQEFTRDSTNWVFQHWNDFTDNPRALYVSGNLSVTAYYAPAPWCAMRTKTDGYFYIPDISTSRLKVEMLFNNTNPVGDQNGGAPPYYSVKSYPDGQVDMRDMELVIGKYGKCAGQDGWEYMADVNPDMKIDVSDLWVVARNFGKSGTWITDLSGVTIAFNTGEEVSPDSSGFLAIPSGATSFTVKRAGNPIGALITFW
jgi:hypothetical protein